MGRNVQKSYNKTQCDTKTPDFSYDVHTLIRLELGPDIHIINRKRNSEATLQLSGFFSVMSAPSHSPDRNV